MKKIFILVLMVLLTSCASFTSQPTQKNLSRDAISKISNIEIFYHDNEFGIVDAGGSGATGLSGAFGIVGMFAGLAIDAGSRLTSVDRAESRSKEFNAKAFIDLGNDNITDDFANNLAEKLRSAGKKVKLTKIFRPLENLETTTPKDVVPTAGYASLYLRITTGYAAESSTSNYKSVVVVQTVLKDESGKLLRSDSFKKRDFSESYYTYSGLLKNSKKAIKAIKAELMDFVPSTYDNLFVFDVSK